MPTWRLETRFEAFRYHKEAFEAARTAPETAAATTAPASSFANMADVAEAARRAEKQTAALRARARALSEQIRMASPGTPSGGFDPIQDQLDTLSRDAAVEEDLARIKAQIGPRARST